jgi:hypothetical protein
MRINQKGREEELLSSLTGADMMHELKMTMTMLRQVLGIKEAIN